ncbi:MAG TPA: ThuA domain-containing protein [Limnochordia bacterium]
MKRALIVHGGWEGHEPAQVADIFRGVLERQGWAVEVSDSLDAFTDEPALRALDLIIPIWTMGKITQAQLGPVLRAVESGVGLAGCHGGMCDAFRESTDWQFMTGGQWVAHPGNDGVEYVVHVHKGSHPIVDGIDDFTVRSEQYYMHVDPAVKVLATTRFPVVDGPHAANGPVDMPVVWIKRWGKGRVFYCSLGHHADIVAAEPVLTLMTRGFLWAAEGKGAH